MDAAVVAYDDIFIGIIEQRIGIQDVAAGQGAQALEQRILIVDRQAAGKGAERTVYSVGLQLDAQHKRALEEIVIDGVGDGFAGQIQIVRDRFMIPPVENQIDK